MASLHQIFQLTFFKFQKGGCRLILIDSMYVPDVIHICYKKR